MLGPAIGLLVVGILQLLMVPVIFALFEYASFHVGPTQDYSLALLSIVVPGLIFVVGLLSDRGRAENEAA